jgi:preprotein translocase subunit SecG
MQTILIVVHLFLAVALIGMILIQHGKGADMGAAFGSGASGTVFGAKGSASFLTRLTAGLATAFFITSMVMAYFSAQRDDGSVIFDALPQAEVEAEAQPQTDLPPMPADSDVPAAPGESGEGAAEAPADDVPAAAAPEQADAPATEAPATEAPAADAVDEASAEAQTDESAAAESEQADAQAEPPATETTDEVTAEPQAEADTKE